MDDKKVVAMPKPEEKVKKETPATPKKGFRKQKKLTHKQRTDQAIQQIARQMQFIGAHTMQHMQELNNQKSEIGAIANLLRMENVDEVIKEGDWVMVDHFGRLVNEDGTLGETFDGGYGKGYVIQGLGKGILVKDIEEALIGKKVGDSVEIDVVFPENYQDKKLVGKKAKFYMDIIRVWRSIASDSNVDQKRQDFLEAKAKDAKAAQPKSEASTEEVKDVEKKTD